MTDTPDVTTPQSTEGDKAMSAFETFYYGKIPLQATPDGEMLFRSRDLYKLPFLYSNEILMWAATTKVVRHEGILTAALHRSTFVDFVIPEKKQELQDFYKWADQQIDLLLERDRKAEHTNEASSDNDSRETTQ